MNNLLRSNLNMAFCNQSIILNEKFILSVFSIKWLLTSKSYPPIRTRNTSRVASEYFILEWSRSKHLLRSSEKRRACLATLDDCGLLYCGRVVRDLTAQQCCATETEIYGVTWMPTIQQLIRKPRQPKIKRSKSQHLEQCPQKRGVCTCLYYNTQKAELSYAESS